MEVLFFQMEILFFRRQYAYQGVSMRFYKMLLALILSTNLANAYDTTIIYNEDKPIFKLDFYNKGENTVFW